MKQQPLQARADNGSSLVISLIGLTGTGKSTIGRQLAARLHLPFIDLDEAIVLREGRSIPEIFSADGEEGFRRIEADLLRVQCAENSSKILSTGGGAILRGGNRQLLKHAGPVIWLDAPLEIVARRVGGDKNRPLIHNSNALKKVKEMDLQRRDYYRSCASYSVDTSQAGIDETVDAIMAYLSESGYV